MCLLHIASASLLCIEHCTIQTARTMWAQDPSPEKGVCLALLVHPGIRVLRCPDLALRPSAWPLCLIDCDPGLLRHNKNTPFFRGTLGFVLKQKDEQIDKTTQILKVQGSGG